MARYIVQVKKTNDEWLVAYKYTFKWLASLGGAKLLRMGWEVRIVDVAQLEKTQ